MCRYDTYWYVFRYRSTRHAQKPRSSDPVHAYNQHHILDNDSDSDSDENAYAEGLSDIDSNENDTYDDLENQLLDEIEFKNDLAVFHPTADKKEECSNDHNAEDDSWD